MSPTVKLKPAPCLQCRYEGMQEIASPDRPRSIERLGITPYGANKWRVLRCPHCGNVQLFLVER